MYDQTAIQPEAEAYPAYPSAVYQPAHPLAPVPASPKHRGLFAVLLGAAILAVLALVAGGYVVTHANAPKLAATEVGGEAPPTTAAGDPTTTTSTVADSTTTQSTAAGATAGAPAGAKATGGQPGAQPAGGAAPAAPKGPAPVITSFTTPDTIDCHNGNFQMFTAKWTTTNATKTTISIDGPGVFQAFGPNDTASLPFSCTSAHTFLLTAFGQNGQTTTKSITLQPRNVQPPSPPSGDPGDAPVASGQVPVPH
jgi:hypothetical protein